MKITKKSKREKNKEIIKFCQRCNATKREEIEKNNIPASVPKSKKNVTEKVTNKSAKMTHSKMTHTKPNLGQKGKIEKKQKGGKVTKKKLPKPTEKPSIGLSSFLKKF